MFWGLIKSTLKSASAEPLCFTAFLLFTLGTKFYIIIIKERARDQREYGKKAIVAGSGFSFDTV